MAGVWVWTDELLALGAHIAQRRKEPLIRLTGMGEKVADFFIPLIDMAREESPSVILFPTGIEVEDLAARLAQEFKCPMVSGCSAVRYMEEPDCLEMERLIFGGAAIQVVRNQAWPVILTLAPGASGEEGDPDKQGQYTTREISPVSSDLWQVVERKGKESTSKSLGEAQIIVSVGRGLKKVEDLSLVKELASAMGGEIGCTRPIAAELHWLPESACVGLTGTQVKPELYLALGISGQIQHTTGIRQSRVIVAVNLDEKAPIFETADFGVVGDLYTFIPLFLAALKEKS